MAKQTKEELAEYLREQMDFLRSSSEAFDQGKESEAKRLAVVLRVLLYNTKKSHSLLKQLRVQHQLKFLDTKRRPAPAKPGVITRTWDAGLAVIELGPDGTRYKAPLGSVDVGATFGSQAFRYWWNREIMMDEKRVKFTREEFVLFMAHKVGGAHVDPEIKQHFKALTQLNSLGWVRIHEDGKPGVGVPAAPGQQGLGNPIPANVRQIAYEVEHTVSEQLTYLIVAP